MALKILSVDDEPDLEILLSQKFRKQIRNKEYEFVFAHNGFEALQKLQEHKDVSIILSDINMPEMDGLTLLSKVNEFARPELKTVIVSAYGDMGNIRAAMNKGAFDFATKPIDFDDLQTTLEKTSRHIDQVTKARKEHELLLNIQKDLDAAGKIQQSVIPKIFPPFPGIKEFDIYALMHPAKEIGGDFYDFFFIDNTKLCIVIADVSGKGISAALFMIVTKILIKTETMRGTPFDEVLRKVNNTLCQDNDSSMFATLFCTILDIKTGELTGINAGHNLPCICKTGGDFKFLQLHRFVALGALEDIPYSSEKVKLEPGDMLFLYTDGVTEAHNRIPELYSDQRLMNVLNRLKEKDVRSVVNEVRGDITLFADGAEQSDDITILALKYYGPR